MNMSKENARNDHENPVIPFLSFLKNINSKEQNLSLRYHFT